GAPHLPDGDGPVEGHNRRGDRRRVALATAQSPRSAARKYSWNKPPRRSRPSQCQLPRGMGHPISKTRGHLPALRTTLDSLPVGGLGATLKWVPVACSRCHAACPVTPVSQLVSPLYCVSRLVTRLDWTRGSDRQASPLCTTSPLGTGDTPGWGQAIEA